MANYQSIKGFNVQSKSTDPTPYAQALVDNPWGGVWSSGGAMNTARYRMVGGMGTQTAGYIVGGATPSKANVESYNGSTWSETTDIPTATSDNATMGTATAGASIGGWNSPPPLLTTMEIWNGASWTEGGTLPVGRFRSTAAGTTTAALLVAGGTPPSNNYVSSSVEYDGSSWTTGGSLPAVRANGGQSGTQTAGFVFGGYSPSSGSTISLTYNGTAFSATPGSLNNAYGEAGFSVSGTQSSSWISGGTSPSSGATEYYDGTSWTASGDMAQKRSAGGSLGTGTLGLYAGGSEPSLSPTTTAVTEEFSFSGLPPSTPHVDYSNAIIGDMYYNTSTGQFKAIKTGGAPIGSWASGGTLNTARNVMFSASAAPQSAAMIFGGYVSSPSAASKANTEKYDGTSWTEDSDLNTARRLGVGTGSQPAALASTGQVSPGPGLVANVESWNGSGWSETTDVNTARRNLAAFGIQTASLITGGLTPSVTGITESWNGTSWTEKGDLNTARESFAGFGTSYTSGLVAGGYVSSPTPTSAITETWNGTSWTEVADLNTGRKQHAATGQDVDSGMIVAGYTTTGLANAESWDGTSWAEQADLATARWELGGMGTTSAGLVCGGDTPGGKSNLTEEFTAADFQIKTVTTS